MFNLGVSLIYTRCLSNWIILVKELRLPPHLARCLVHPTSKLFTLLSWCARSDGRTQADAVKSNGRVIADRSPGALALVSDLFEWGWHCTLPRTSVQLSVGAHFISVLSVLGPLSLTSPSWQESDFYESERSSESPIFQHQKVDLHQMTMVLYHFYISRNVKRSWIFLSINFCVITKFTGRWRVDLREDLIWEGIIEQNQTTERDSFSAWSPDRVHIQVLGLLEWDGEGLSIRHSEPSLAGQEASARRLGIPMSFLL